MTLQIVLIGNDGLVVGSDRRIMRRSSPPDMDGQPRFQFSSGTKFTKTEDESLICASAGGPQSSRVADAVIVDWPNSRTLSIVDWQDRMRRAAEAVIGMSDGDEIIIVRKDQPDRAWILNRDRHAVGIQLIQDKLCTGVAAHSVFLSAFLWQPTTVDRLRRLAVLTLGFAAKERPGEVGDGFEIMTLGRSPGVITWEQLGPEEALVTALMNEFVTNSWACLDQPRP